jgi:plasmid maintenance system killer protein
MRIDTTSGCSASIELLRHRSQIGGDLRGRWAVSVRANWRIIFRFDAGHAYDIDLVDYH